MTLNRQTASPLFGEGSTGTLRLVIYLSLAVALMVADRHAHYLIRVRSAGHTLIEPLYRIAALPADLARSARLAVADRQRLTDENARLREQLLLAQARLNRLAAVAEQNQKLKELLEVQHTLGMGVQLAKLIDVDLDPFRHRVMLDVGAEQGVQVGQAVLDARGIMGQVIEAMPHAARVMLVTDPRHAVPVTVERTGLRTIAFGTGAVDRLELPNVPVSADIAPGDRLLTSGLGGSFPAGFPVGEVISISADGSGMFAAAIARPAAALDRSGDVLLLRPLADPVGPPAPAGTVGPPSTPPAAATAPSTPARGAAP